MRLLIRPEPYPDESLESYLLRLSQENGFERYSVFSGSIKSWLRVQDHEAAGAFPLELCRVNVFHASRSSGLRVRALRLIEQLTDQSPSCLLQLALMHSAITFGREHMAVHRGGHSGCTRKWGGVDGGGYSASHHARRRLWRSLAGSDFGRGNFYRQRLAAHHRHLANW